VAEQQIDDAKVEEPGADNDQFRTDRDTDENAAGADSGGGGSSDSSSENSSGNDDGSDPDRLQAQLAEARDQALRYQAETQNALRRAERDVEKAHKFGQEKLIGELLVVVDNLERSITATEGQEISIESIKEGVELTLKSLIDTLKRHNVEQIDPEGEPFDPALHQAMTMVPSAEQEPNSVLNVFQKGYTLHGRLVRPAMVVVAKAPDNQ